MAVLLRFSFKEIVSSQAYQAQAASWAKKDIFVGIAAAVATAWLGDATLGLRWIWVLPALLFGIPLLISLPTMLVHVWLAALQSGHMRFEPSIAPTPIDMTGRALGLLKGSWSLASLALAAYASFLFVNWVSGGSGGDVALHSGGTHYEAHCPQPLPVFTLGEHSSPTKDQETALCACVWENLSRKERDVSERIVRGRESEIADIQAQAFIARFGSAITKCGGMKL